MYLSSLGPCIPRVRLNACKGYLRALVPLLITYLLSLSTASPLPIPPPPPKGCGSLLILSGYLCSPNGGKPDTGHQLAAATSTLLVGGTCSTAHTRLAIWCIQHNALLCVLLTILVVPMIILVTPSVRHLTQSIKVQKVHACRFDCNDRYNFLTVQWKKGPFTHRSQVLYMTVLLFSRDKKRLTVLYVHRTRTSFFQLCHGVCVHTPSLARSMAPSSIDADMSSMCMARCTSKIGV